MILSKASGDKRSLGTDFPTVSVGLCTSCSFAVQGGGLTVYL